MNEKDNKDKDNISVNISQSKIEPLNTNTDNNLLNPQIVEVNRHQDLMEVLRRIERNTSGRRNGDGDSVSLCVVFLIGLFFIYMGICFYRDGGFNTIVGPKLFFMIIALFLAIILLHREEHINTMNNIRKKVEEG
jgi:YbbR domain-containing protein